MSEAAWRLINKLSLSPFLPSSSSSSYLRAWTWGRARKAGRISSGLVVDSESVGWSCGRRFLARYGKEALRTLGMPRLVVVAVVVVVVEIELWWRSYSLSLCLSLCTREVRSVVDWLTARTLGSSPPDFAGPSCSIRWKSFEKCVYTIDPWFQPLTDSRFALGRCVDRLQSFSALQRPSCSIQWKSSYLLLGFFLLRATLFQSG